MSDELLKKLGALEREQTEKIDPRIDRLADPTIDPKARAELQALAAGDAVEAFTPLGDDARERMAKKAIAAFGSKPAIVDLAARRRRMISVLAVLATAAAIALLSLRPSVSPLPEYAFEINTGDRVFRSDRDPPAATPSFAPSSTIEIVLRPATAIDTPVEARAFYADVHGAHALALRFESAPGGSLRLRGAASELLNGVEGEIELGFIVGREGSLPSVEAAWDERALKDRAWHLVSRRVQITTETK